MALFMSFLTIFATAVLADRGQPVVLRALAVVSCLLSLPLLILARSAGAAVTTAASMGVLLCILVFSRLRPQERLLLLLAIAAVMLPFAAVIGVLAVNGTLEESASTFLIQVLGKDATLTGRTVLWEIALVEIAKRPWFGVGYYGFWLQGNLLAESIWRHFSIESRMGFHFHNTYLEVAVELGWFGCGLLLVTFILAIARAIRQALGERSWHAASAGPPAPVRPRPAFRRSGDPGPRTAAGYRAPP